MKFREDGTFHILQFADIQEIPDVSEDTQLLLNAALEKARPDLVVLTGDQLKGASRRFSGKGERVEETIRRIMKPVTDRKIPFAVTFGNHDLECGLQNDEQMEIYRSLPGCVDWLNRRGQEIHHGTKEGTFAIGIRSSDETKVAMAVYLFDTGGTLPQGGYIADFVGPLGTPTHIEGLKKVAVVGGGVGCAIALPVARALHEQGTQVTSIVGFRNQDLVILEEEFKACSDRFYMMTDDGSYGEKGNVCVPLNRLLESGETFDAVITIGPLIMMKFVAEATKPYGIKTIASMNPIMIDGTGMCGCCRVTVGGEMKFACVDGPDFDAHLIDFDEAMKRSRTYVEFEAKAREKHCNLFKKEVN